MATITAADVKKLRDLTGAGMMECKKALTEADGDIDKAVEVLRISGAAKAAKRGAERTASNGVVAQSGNALVELRCETDFVAKNADFIALADELAQAVDADPSRLRCGVRGADPAVRQDRGRQPCRTCPRSSARRSSWAGSRRRRDGRGLPAPPLRRPAAGGRRAARLHRRAGGGARRRAADRCHASPSTWTATSSRRRRGQRARIAEATAREEGKPEQALPKIIEGRVNGFFKDTVLLDQPSVQEHKKTVAQVLAEAGTTVTGFARIEVGQD